MECSRHDKSLLSVDRLSMHVVEHQRNTTITHTLTLYRCTEMCKMLFERGNEFFVQKVHCSHSVDCWTLLCHVSNKSEVLLAHVSFIAAGSLLLLFWRCRVGRAWLGMPTLHIHTISKVGALHSRIQALFQYSVGQRKYHGIHGI
jgi:hypothetical protein